MREADRPVELRVSVLDRPRTADDLPPERYLGTGMLGGRVDEASVHLVQAREGCRLYAARGANDDDLYLMFVGPGGGGSCGGPRSTLATHGASVMWNSSNDGCVLAGIVPDPVIAVHVDGVAAAVANNGFILRVPAPRGRIVLTTADGEREYPQPPSLLRPLRTADEATTPGRGYLGMVEYAQSGLTDVAIDDLDIPDWHGEIQGVFLAAMGQPDVRPVGVVLLEGPRAGELALADLVVRRREGDRPTEVTFNGHTPFGPHPDPPRLEAALQRLRDLGGRF
jgi:hypothetical protein